MENEKEIKTSTALIDEAVLSNAKADFERDRVKNSLDACLLKVPDRKEDIEAAFEGVNKSTGWEKAFIILVTEIEEAVRGRMIVPLYSQKSMAKQEIYVFVGSHWEVIPIQMYYDFIREACKRLGLSVLFYQNYRYMNQVFEQVAFSVSKHICTAQPHDGVWINLRNGTIEIAAPSPVNGLCTPFGSPVSRGTETLPSGGAANAPIINFREHRAEDFFLYCIPYCYDPAAECPLWLRFLDEVLQEKEAQQLLGEYIGYCFTRNLKLEKMAVLYGSGANGKSVVLDVIKSLVGRENVSEATLSSVTNDSEARCVMQNKLLNISSESGKNLNPAVLKQLVSGEPVEMRKLYIGVQTLYNPPKFITSYNVLPPIENTYGYKRRWIIFPFNRTIPDDQQDPMLTARLCRELPGILNWVLRHLGNLLVKVHSQSGEDFVKSDICQMALAEYFKDANSINMFLDECCRIDDSVSVPMKELYAHYVEYCKCSGINKPSILRNFKKSLIDWGATETVVAQKKYFNVYVNNEI